MQSISLQDRKNQIASTYGVGTAFEKSQDSDIMKGGEGTKGGKVIGHTKSGKPIYEDHTHKSHKDFTSQDHAEAFDAHVHSRRAFDKTGEGKAEQEASSKRSYYGSYKQGQKARGDSGEVKDINGNAVPVPSSEERKLAANRNKKITSMNYHFAQSKK